MSLPELAILDPINQCTRAAVLIFAGQFEEAKEALGDFWRGLGEVPAIDNCQPEIAAEVLLQCGCLSGFLADAKASDAHEQAQNLLTRALGIFESHQNHAKVSEAKYELGICYFRKGSYDEARIVLQAALEGAPPEQHGKIVIGQTIVEILTGHYEEARDILLKSHSFFECASDALKGRWHGHMGLIHRRMARGRIEYLDRAIIEFTAAIYHYQQAGHIRYCGSNLNNLAMIYCRLGRYVEAHEQLDRAHLIFSGLRDQGNIAQVAETRTRTLIAEGRYQDAWRVIIGVIDILELSGERALLVDALTNKAIVQARLGDRVRSSQTFSYATQIGEESGALFNAGLAALSMMEELSLSSKELREVYRAADRYLSRTQDEEVMARLRDCARLAVEQLGVIQLHKNFSLPSVLHNLEASFIEEALTKTEGRITKAASLLGISHQALHLALDHRHKQLHSKRSQVVRRRKSIIKKPKV